MGARGRVRLVVLMLSMVAATLLAVPPAAVAQPTLPTDFVIENVMDVSDTVLAAGMAFLPGEPLLAIAGKRGLVDLYGEDGTRHGRILDISDKVNHNNDHGLTGIAFHPDFDRADPATRLLYLWYVWDPDGLADEGSGRRISRLTSVELAPVVRDLGAGVQVQSYEVVPGSEAVVLGGAGMADPWAPTPAELEAALGPDPDCATTGGLCFPGCLNDGDPSNDADCLPTAACTDGAGYLEDCVAADDTLHAVGTLRFGPDGALHAGHGDGASASVADPRAFRAGDPDSLNGKVLRIDPATGLGLPDNPWYSGDPTDNRSRVVAAGLRNPFRFAVHPERNDLLLGDVGFSTMEEVNAGQGGTHGWPCYEGGQGENLPTFQYSGEEACQDLYDDVANGAVDITPALHAYRHDSYIPPGADPPSGGSIIGGDWFRGTGWPLTYQEGWFFSDFEDRTLSYLPAARDSGGLATGNLADAELFATDIGFVVDVQLAPDGTLWLLDIVDGSIQRVRYVGEDPNRAPVISPPADQASGLGGDVNLQLLASDPDGQPVTFSVDPAGPLPPGIVMSPTGRITGQPTTPGTYDVIVVATDGDRTSSSTFQWTVDTTYAPQASITSPTVENGYAIGDMVAMTGEATDAEDGQMTGTSLEWHVQIHHNNHVHPDEASGTGASLAPFWIPDHGSNWYLTGCLTATDSSGYTDVECIDLRMDEHEYTITTDPPGLPVLLGGAQITQPTSFTLYTNQRVTVSSPLQQGALTFVGWSSGRARTHAIVGGVSTTDVVARYVDTAAPTNQALTGTARQSTTHTYTPCGPHAASKAIDGSVAGYEGDCSISHTSKGTNQWWEVDLGGIRLVEEVRVWNWLQHSLGRLSNGHVMVSPTPFGSRTLDQLLADPTITVTSFSATVGRPTTFVEGVRGRYVRILLEGPGRELVMSEVQVIAGPLRPPVGAVSVPAGIIQRGAPAPLVADSWVDPDASSLAYAWTLDGASSAGFDDPTSATPTLDTTDLTSGVHTVTVTVTDGDGQTAQASADIEIESEPLPPVAAIADPGPAVDAGTPVPLDASSSSDPQGAALTFAWDLDDDGAFDDATGATTTLDTTGFPAGTHPVAVRVTNTFGLQDTASASVAVTEPVDPADPPVAALADPGPAVAVGTVLDMDASASTDPEGGPLAFAWDVDDDGAFDADEGTTAINPVDTALLGAGDHDITVRVTSGASGLQDTATRVLSVRTPPTATIDDPEGPYEVGQQVPLDASTSTDPHGGSLAFAWDLDEDGAFDDATGPETTLDTTGFAVGIHEVVVRVTSDATGLAGEAVARIAVTDPAPGGGGGDPGGGGSPGGGGGGVPIEPEPEQADVSLDLTASPREVAVDEPVVITTRVHNDGPAEAPVLLALDLGDLDLVAAPEDCRAVDGSLTCEGVRLAAGQSHELEVELSASTVGSQTVEATATVADVVDPTPDDLTASTTFSTFDAQSGGEDAISPAALAIELSQRLYRDVDGTRGEGRRQAAAVVLSRDDAFADSLTGSALTGDSPLLFTDRAQLDPATAAEIRRMLPLEGEVLVLGGEAALSAAVADELADMGYLVRRLAGPSRVETSVAIAEEVARRHDEPRQVGIARADGPSDNPTAAWADSVTAGGWAARTQQPILLTPTAELHPAVGAWLAEHGNAVPIVMGGEAAVSADVARAVGPHLRHAGANRYETAAMIAERRWDDPAGYLVTAGDHELGWAYGLAAAGLSAATNQPLLLVEQDRLPEETATALCDGRQEARVEFVGGADVVSSSVRDAVAAVC